MTAAGARLGTSLPHGAYNRYRSGCRCAACREAKAAYVRAARATASERRLEARRAGVVYVAEGITHGYAGYQEAACRCETCVAAKAAAYAASSKKVGTR
jgi:hypothetical protein